MVQAALLEALAAVLLHLEDVSDNTLQQCVALVDRLAGEGHDKRVRRGQLPCTLHGSADPPCLPVQYS